MKTTALTRGARAVIYREGADPVLALNIPGAGAFAVRSLPPGTYVCRDSAGGERPFRVNAQDEQVVLLEGETAGPTGEPGMSGVARSDTLHVGRAPAIRSPTQVAPGAVSGPEELTKPTTPGDEVNEMGPRRLPARAKSTGVEPGEDVRVPGGAGAGFAAEVPSRSAADELHADEPYAGSTVKVPETVRTTEAPEPDRDTILPESGLARALQGEPEGAPAPAPAKKAAARRRPAKKPAAAKKGAK